jgi:hypothetical protein
LGQWYGQGAKTLGLSGVTRGDEFLRLCENLRPQTGERLTLRQKTTRTERNARPPIDAGSTTSLFRRRSQVRLPRCHRPLNGLLETAACGDLEYYRYQPRSATVGLLLLGSPSPNLLSLVAKVFVFALGNEAWAQFREEWLKDIERSSY